MIPVTCIEVVIIYSILSRWNVPIHRSITIFLGTPIQNRASLSQGTLKPWHILCDEVANLLWKGGKKSPAVPAVGKYQVQSHGRDGWTPCAAGDCIKHVPKRWYFLWYWSPERAAEMISENDQSLQNSQDQPGPRENPETHGFSMAKSTCPRSVKSLLTAASFLGSRCEKNKMKPTNPNAHTYVNGTDVNTHGYAVTHNTFLQ